MSVTLPFQGGAYGTTATYNFVNSMDLHRPEFDPELTQKFGDQGLAGFLTMIGAEKSVSAIEYNHFEEERIYPKIKATTAGAGAGASATFTLDAAATLSISDGQSPYVGTTSSQIVTPRVQDIIMIKPASGTVSASTYIRALVTSVNKSAGTFVAYPTDGTDSIPAIAAAEEIIIIGNAHGEGSGQPESRQGRVSKYTNSLQIVKETFKQTGTEKSLVTWAKLPGKGKSGYVWYLKGESDTYKNFMSQKELSLMLNEQLTNTTLADQYAANPLTMTEGLIPWVLNNGNQANYASATGFSKQDAETLAKTLDKNKGSKVNMMAVGMDLSINIDNTLADNSVNGGIVYGGYSFDEAAARAFEFKSFSVGGYRFDKKTFDVFNDLQTLGAAGYEFPSEGIVIPMDKKAVNGGMVQSLQLRYLVDPETGERFGKTVAVNLFDITGEDAFEVRYKDACGFEGFAANRWAYIKKA